jgi:predicted ATPase with chaperone activity
MARGDDLSDCRCPESSRLKYISRFSGPLLDRVGMKLFLTKEERSLPKFFSDPKTIKESHYFPLEEENARQGVLIKKIWNAYKFLVGESEESIEYFKTFLEEQKSFQSRWLCRV